MHTIRESRSDDLPNLKRLVAELHESQRPFEPTLPPAETIVEAYLGQLREACGLYQGTIFVLDVAGAAVGYVCVLAAHPQSEVDEAPELYAYIFDLYVRAPYRGRGLGRQLLATAEDFARAHGAKRIVLRLFAGNTRALNLYQDAGYRCRVQELCKPL